MAWDSKKALQTFYVWDKTRTEELRPAAQGGSAQKEVRKRTPYLLYLLLFSQSERTSRFIIYSKEKP